MARVWVTAPPVDGAANEAVCRVVAEKLDIAPSRVSIVRGHQGREKTLAIAGLDDSAVRERLSR